MIFATVGSMFPFDRFAQALDEWARDSGYDDVLLQIGEGEYIPQYVKWVRTLRPAEFKQAVADCDLVVAHLGMGSIITAMQAVKPIVLFPRARELGEHTSDHQAHGVEWLDGRPGLWIAHDIPQLRERLDEFRAGTLIGSLDAVSPHASDELIGHVREFIFREPSSS